MAFHRIEFYLFTATALPVHTFCCTCPHLSMDGALPTMLLFCVRTFLPCIHTVDKVVCWCKFRLLNLESRTNSIIFKLWITFIKILPQFDFEFAFWNIQSYICDSIEIMEQFIVSARKYRPQTFKDVVGNKLLPIMLLKCYWKRIIWHKPSIFTGPRGVGKTTVQNSSPKNQSRRLWWSGMRISHLTFWIRCGF